MHSGAKRFDWRASMRQLQFLERAGGDGLMSMRGLILASLSALSVLAFVLGVAAPDATAAGSCPNEQFRTGPGAQLPDCRAYEMVSPPDKNGGEVDGGSNFHELVSPEQAAADGEAVTYGSSSAFVEADPVSAVVTSQYVSRRMADGWSTREVTPTQQLPEGHVLTAPGVPAFSLFQGFSEDLSGFLLAWNPQPDSSAPAGYYNPYLYEGGTGGYQLLSSVVPPSHSNREGVELWCCGFSSTYAGMSADGRHVIFQANDALTPEAVPGRVNLYEWSAGRPLELVSVLPEGTVDTDGGVAPQESALNFGESDGIQNGFPFNFSDALSSDGMRAFWTDGGGQVYMHEITESGARTVDVSASQKVGEPDAVAKYWAANAKGSLVYFTSGGQLTADSTASSGGADLYQYDVQTEGLHDLSVALHTGETARVQGVLGTGESEGVPYVYFVARGVLAEGATADKENIYVSRGGSSAPVFIATLGEFQGELSDFAADVMERTSRVSPDGKLLAFQSERPLTGYDNTPANGRPCPEPIREADAAQPYSGGVRCMEVFEYNAQTGSLVCASCDPSGLPPTSDSLVPETQHQLENVYGWESSTVQQRYLLDDGRLFFQSEDALLPEATNGRQNVYEYEPEGAGQCATSGGGGCLYLISSGEGSEDSFFADASADGRDVFFLTNQQLVPQDGDGAVDMYDAREGGGFSAATPPPCSGEACKPAITPAPAIYGAPSSETFEGAGNPPSTVTVKPKSKTKSKPSTCRKGYRRRNGRCVKNRRVKRSIKRKRSR
jgi:hypothetical protein